MTIQEIANRLVHLCRQGQYEQAVHELYDHNARSVEPEGSNMPSVQGLDQFEIKGKAFEEQIAQHNSSSVSDPIVAENFFAIGMYMNVDFVDGPKSVDMNEICLYEVRDGKIVREEFRYAKEDEALPSTAEATTAIANRYIELFRQGKMAEIVQELYAPDAFSVEPEGSHYPTKVQGLDKMALKGETWRQMVSGMNSVDLSPLVVADNYFALGMYINVDMHNGQKGVDMDELCIFEVRDGKIVQEEFFYTPVPQPTA